MQIGVASIGQITLANGSSSVSCGPIFSSLKYCALLVRPCRISVASGNCALYNGSALYGLHLSNRRSTTMFANHVRKVFDFQANAETCFVFRVITSLRFPMP